MKSFKLNEQQKEIFLNTIAILILLLIAFPLYWMLVNSLKYRADIFKSPPSLFPNPISFEAYYRQLTGIDYNVGRAFLNSLIISSCTMVLAVMLSIPAAYGLARYNFKARKVFIFGFLVTQMLPTVFTLIPLFILFKNIGAYNTFFAPILADATIGIPFAVLILRTYFVTIPKELDDAASIDGCNSLTAFVRIMVPIASPGIIVSAVFSFLFAWGDMTNGLTYINNQDLWPITTALYNFIGRYGIMWDSTMAFGILSILPVVIIFITMQKYIISGLTNGAVKG